jgi:hypothetical protein
MILQYVWAAVVIPCAAALERSVRLSPWGNSADPAEVLIPAVVLGALFAVMVWGARRTHARARAKAVPEVEIAAAGLIAELAVGVLLPIPALMVAPSAGWGWGSAFYSVYVLYVIRATLLWRKLATQAFQLGRGGITNAAAR